MIDKIINMLYLYLYNATVSRHILRKVFFVRCRIKDFSAVCPISERGRELC